MPRHDTPSERLSRWLEVNRSALSPYGVLRIEQVIADLQGMERTHPVAVALIHDEAPSC